jgi:peptidoglycan/xylan/chitin deacetylase (PgdA/CDA1 family)
MSQFKKIYYAISSLLPTELVKAITPSTTLLPYHHLVSDHEVLHVKHLYPYKNVNQFKTDLDFLLKHLKPVSVTDVVEAVKTGKNLSPNSFLLTFDDGFREVHEIIAPILLQKGVPAIFFINPAFIDNRELFYRSKISLLIEEVLKLTEKNINWTSINSVCNSKLIQTKDGLIQFIKSITNANKEVLDDLAALLSVSFTNYLQTVKPFLSTEQLNDLSKQGFSIGAHSWDHPYYHLLSVDEQLKQTVSSGNYVTKEFQQPHKLFSFPHEDTSLSQLFFDRLKQEWDADILFGIQNQKLEQQNKTLHRFNAERPGLPMSRQLNGVLLLMLFQKLTGKNTVTRKL